MNFELIVPLNLQKKPERFRDRLEGPKLLTGGLDHASFLFTAQTSLFRYARDEVCELGCMHSIPFHSLVGSQSPSGGYIPIPKPRKTRLKPIAEKGLKRGGTQQEFMINFYNYSQTLTCGLITRPPGLFRILPSQAVSSPLHDCGGNFTRKHGESCLVLGITSRRLGCQRHLAVVCWQIESCAK